MIPYVLVCTASDDWQNGLQAGQHGQRFCGVLAIMQAQQPVTCWAELPHRQQAAADVIA